MVNTSSIELRSKIMRSVKSKGNLSTEIKLIGLFKKHKISGWRRGYKIKGNPDFCFPKLRIAIFVDGCFWHGHNCRNLKPKTNANYWKEKIARNKKRDRLVTKSLREKGWIIIRIWECDLKNEPAVKRKLTSLTFQRQDLNE